MDQSVSPPVARTGTTPASSPTHVPPPAPQASPPRVAAPPRRSIWTIGRGRLPLGPKTFALAGLVLLALGYGGRELYLRLTHIYEYDARVTADIVTISSRADGWVVEMSVREGMRVQAGQVVAKIDDRAARLKSDSLQAQIEGVRAERTRLRAERRLTLNQAEALARTRASVVQARERAVAAAKSDLDFAKGELERQWALFERRVSNERALQVAQAAAEKLGSQLQQAHAELDQALNSLAEAKVEQDKLGVIDAQIAALDHQIASLAAQMHQQNVDVEDRTIRSPIPAIIDRTFVLPGEYVQSGQRILLLHNPEEVWVEANIKETQVGRLKVGQPVLVTVDAYPGERFTGRVARIGSATTARFALLPTPNPSGNFTKITQRMPVKIDMVEMPKPLTPGMMVEVEIDVR